MAEQFAPLSVELIDEGRFLANLNDDLLDAQQRLVEYVRLHGKQAEKATAVLTVKVKLICTDTENEGFAVKSTNKVELPGRPPSVSLAMGVDTEAGAGRLFVRRSGSSRSHPRQRVLSTEDGKRVDPKTGEVAE